MRAKDIKVNKDIPLTRPKGVSETEWETAKAVYMSALKAGDKFPELTVAQAALETGWFRHVPANYNYFGQKASKSEAGNMAITKEASGNKYYKTSSKFKSYSSLDEALSDRVKKWGTKYQGASNTSEALYSIWSYDPKKGRGTGYATAPDYDKKIGSVLKMMGSSFDTKPSEYKGEQSIPQESATFDDGYTPKFEIQSGEFTPTYTSFTYDLEKEAIKENKQESSEVRTEINEVQDAKNQYLQEYSKAFQQIPIDQPQRESEMMSDDEAYSAYLTDIPVQTELPQFNSIFTTS